MDYTTDCWLRYPPRMNDPQKAVAAEADAVPDVSMARRFRGFLPVVVDVETGGFDAERDALLEIAACVITMDEAGVVQPGATVHAHVMPFPGANLDPRSLEITGIDPDHPFRDALDEGPALKKIFGPIRKAVKAAGCSRAVLVGHNPILDLTFLNAAVRRTGQKRNPFHPFSSFDTATLGGLAYGQTVLSRAVVAAGGEWDQNEAHSALYDTQKTADLFCGIVNAWHRGIDIPQCADRNGAGQT